MPEEVCEWKLHDAFEADYFETSCKEAFTFIDGGPAENRLRFCCYCGKKLVVVPPDRQEDE